MKVVFYKGQKKLTVDNVIIPNAHEFQEFINDIDPKDMLIDEAQLHDFRITATRSMLSDFDVIEDEELAKEIEEGILCRQETVN